MCKKKAFRRINLLVFATYKFFLQHYIVFSGSFHTAMKSPLPIWSDTAKKAFSYTKDDDFVNRRGVYDKIIIDCTFRENLMRRKLPDSTGGCEGFYPSLTTNGMCYTFNGKETSELWKSSEMITTFANLFPLQSANNKFFGGSRSVQGKY